MKRVSALFFALLLTACGEPEGPKIELAGKVSKESAEQAMQAFKSACPNIFKDFRGDIQSVLGHVNTFSPGDGIYRHEETGRLAEIELVVKVHDRALGTVAEIGAKGQTLRFFIGGGRKPGVYAQGAIAARICGWQPAPGGGDLFVVLPGAAALRPIGG